MGLLSDAKGALLSDLSASTLSGKGPHSGPGSPPGALADGESPPELRTSESARTVSTAPSRKHASIKDVLKTNLAASSSKSPHTFTNRLQSAEKAQACNNIDVHTPMDSVSQSPVTFDASTIFVAENANTLERSSLSVEPSATECTQCEDKHAQGKHLRGPESIRIATGPATTVGLAELNNPSIASALPLRHGEYHAQCPPDSAQNGGLRNSSTHAMNTAPSGPSSLEGNEPRIVSAGAAPPLDLGALPDNIAERIQLLKPVVHEHVRHVEIEEVTRERHVEKHVYHIQPYVVPITDHNIGEEQASHQVLPTSHVVENQAALSENQALLDSILDQVRDMRISDTPRRLVHETGSITYEHVHNHVINVISLDSASSIRDRGATDVAVDSIRSDIDNKPRCDACGSHRRRLDSVPLMPGTWDNAKVDAPYDIQASDKLTQSLD